MRAALDAFGARTFEDVGVGEIARTAGVTVGALYHHFGSKIGLYDLVRGDVERRVLDRIEGAAAVRPVASPADLAEVLLVGFDALVEGGFARLLCDPHLERADDPVVRFAASALPQPGVGALVVAAWRAALGMAVDGSDVGAAAARAAFASAFAAGA